MKIDKCRLCLTGDLSEPKLKFPPTPLANEFLKESQEQDLFPLDVCVCLSCGHYQLNEQVEPERLFRNYLFVAGTSPVNVEHFRKYAKDTISRFDLGPGSRVLDIASNDGTLLKHFRDQGMSVLGIDPARNLAETANKNGIPTISEFFTEKFADFMVKEYGKFDLITANNVFAHVPNLNDFARGVKKLLKPGGWFVFEVSYFLDVCDKTLFDTCYHEHMSYHTVMPLVKFFYDLGMDLTFVDHIDNHGGSIRVSVVNQEHSPGGRLFFIGEMLEREKDIAQKVERLSENIKSLGLQLRDKLQLYKSQRKSIAIYGVPAKATTLMYALDIDEELIDFSGDDAPLKQGTFTPGKHIPVLAPSAIYEKKPDVLLVLAWNFAPSIIKQHSEFKGIWLVPIPELKEYNI